MGLRVVRCRSVIVLVINKLDSRFAVVQFRNHSYDYRPNRTPLSPINIINPRLQTGNQVLHVVKRNRSRTLQEFSVMRTPGFSTEAAGNQATRTFRNPKAGRARGSASSSSVNGKNKKQKNKQKNRVSNMRDGSISATLSGPAFVPSRKSPSVGSLSRANGWESSLICGQPFGIGESPQLKELMYRLLVKSNWWFSISAAFWLAELLPDYWKWNLNSSQLEQSFQLGRSWATHLAWVGSS